MAIADKILHPVGLATGTSSLYDLTSYHALALDPEIAPYLIEEGGAWGLGKRMFDFLNAISTGTVGSRKHTIFSQVRTLRPMKVGGSGIATSSAGAAITVTIDAAELDDSTNGNSHLRVGETFEIPGKYLIGGKTAKFRISAITGGSQTGLGNSITANPFNSAVGVSTLVPVGTLLKVGETTFAPGSNPIYGGDYGYLKRDYYTGISRDGFGFEGGQLAERFYQFADGKVYIRGQEAAEFRLENQMESAILTGEANGNSLKSTSGFDGRDKYVRSTKGIIPWMNELAQSYTYNSNFGIFDFDNIRPLMLNAGVTSTTVSMMHGPNVTLMLENSGLEFIKEYSNSDFLMNMSKLNVDFRVFKKNNVNFVSKELISFADPNSYGCNSDYPYADMIMMIPLASSSQMVSADGSFEGATSVKIPNLSLNYFSRNGEDRSRIFTYLGGENGAGHQAKTGGDYLKWSLLSEYMLRFTNVNETILCTKL